MIKLLNDCCCCCMSCFMEMYLVKVVGLMFRQGDPGDPGLPGFKGDKVSTALLLPLFCLWLLGLQIYVWRVCPTLPTTLTWDQRFSLVPPAPTHNKSYYPHHSPSPWEHIRTLYAITLKRLDSDLKRSCYNIMQEWSKIVLYLSRGQLCSSCSIKSIRSLI